MYNLSSVYKVDSFGFNYLDIEVNLVKVPNLLDSYYEVDLSLQSTGKLLSSDINNTATVILLPQYNLSDEGSLTLSVSDYLTVDRVSTYSSDFCAQTCGHSSLLLPK